MHCSLFLLTHRNNKISKLTDRLLNVRLGSGDLGNGNAVRGAGNVVHIQLLKEDDGVRIVGVVPTDAHLLIEVRENTKNLM